MQNRPLHRQLHLKTIWIVEVLPVRPTGSPSALWEGFAMAQCSFREFCFPQNHINHQMHRQSVLWLHHVFILGLVSVSWQYQIKKAILPASDASATALPLFTILFGKQLAISASVRWTLLPVLGMQSAWLSTSHRHLLHLLQTRHTLHVVGKTSAAPTQKCAT